MCGLDGRTGPGDRVPSHLELRVLPFHRKRTAWSMAPPPLQGDTADRDLGPVPRGAHGTGVQSAPTVRLPEGRAPCGRVRDGYLGDWAPGPMPGSLTVMDGFSQPPGMGHGTYDVFCPPVGTQGSQRDGIPLEEKRETCVGTQDDVGAVLEGAHGAIVAGDWALGTITLHRFALGGGSASLAVLPRPTSDPAGHPDSNPLTSRLRFTSELLLGTANPQGSRSPSRHRNEEGRALQAQLGELVAPWDASPGETGTRDRVSDGSGPGAVKEKPLFSWTPLLCNAPIHVRPAQLVCRSLRDLPERERGSQVEARGTLLPSLRLRRDLRGLYMTFL